MNILVIGGAGYIGSHVVLSLRERGFRPQVFDNLSTGTRENLAPDIPLIIGDILDTEALTKALTGVDVVVHLAAKKAVGESMIYPEQYARNNITGALNVLNVAAQTGVKHIVFSSSAAVYGMPETPVLTEQCPPNPINLYGFTKLEIERCLSWYDRLKGITFVALRYFNAVGYDPQGRIHGLEKNPQNLLPIVMETALGYRPCMHIFGNDYPTPDGTCIRDYVHVSDLADAHVRAIDYLTNGGISQVLNLGTGRGISVLEMITAARRITGCPIPADFAPRRSGDPAILTADSTAAHTLLSWTPALSDPDTLIQTTWQAYRNQ